MTSWVRDIQAGARHNVRGILAGAWHPGGCVLSWSLRVRVFLGNADNPPFEVPYEEESNAGLPASIKNGALAVLAY